MDGTRLMTIAAMAAVDATAIAGGTPGIALMQEAISRGCIEPMILLTGQGHLDTDLAAMQAVERHVAARRSVPFDRAHPLWSAELLAPVQLDDHLERNNLKQ